MNKKKTISFITMFLIVTFIFGGCGLFSKKSNRGNYINKLGSSTLPLEDCENGYSRSAVTGECECTGVETIQNGIYICEGETGSECTVNLDCEYNEYCNKFDAVWVCSPQPCMTASDCPLDNITWGTMKCDKTSIPYRCVNEQEDDCQRTQSGGHTCGILSYCDVNSGHPYTCKPQACSGDQVCQKCDAGTSCQTVGGYKINTRPDGSTYKYVCDLDLYIHACKKIEISGPTGTQGCQNDNECDWGGTSFAHCNTTVSPHVCECNNPDQCPSGEFCRKSTKQCQAPSADECTISGNSDNCDDIYFGIDQYFCDNRAPYNCRERISETGSSAHCWRHAQCYTEWCHYSPNSDPLDEPPSSETGHCRATAGDGTLGLGIGENCTDGGQCTGRTGLTCPGGTCKVLYGQSCQLSSDCQSPGVCHTTCYQSNLGANASCSYSDQCQSSYGCFCSDNKCRRANRSMGQSCTCTEQCQGNYQCSGGICKGQNNSSGCANHDNYCMSGNCQVEFPSNCPTCSGTWYCRASGLGIGAKCYRKTPECNSSGCTGGSTECSCTHCDYNDNDGGYVCGIAEGHRSGGNEGYCQCNNQKRRKYSNCTNYKPYHPRRCCP